MNIGTKSILFGVHQFLIHPIFVAIGWTKLYGFPIDPRLWVAFFVHDLGYWGKPNMDGPEGEQHPFLGAIIMEALFGIKWMSFTLYHSRYLAKKHEANYSRLCCADKLATAYVPTWFYLLQANLSGEVHEYMNHGRTAAMERGQWRWARDMQAYCKKWALEHRDCKPDLWTGTIRDHAREVEETKC